MKNTTVETSRTPSLPARKPTNGRVTFEEFCQIINEHQKADLIEGVIVLQSPASLMHEELAIFLESILATFVYHQRLGRVFGSRAAVKFTPYNAPEPDLCYVSSARVHILREQYIAGAPDMICEIISPGTRKIDRNDKMKMYARYGVQEYWLIDPHKQTAEFFRNEQGKWVPIGLDVTGVFRSEVIPGFWLRVDWLFAEEMPDILHTVTTILESSH
ncbi:MAG: Uma2 family endonuclease [candidate division KSB1 bacterium]|nr:Uma2 family endonuclease [candidate division KSB1 bacterium]